MCSLSFVSSRRRVDLFNFTNINLFEHEPQLLEKSDLHQLEGVQKIGLSGHPKQFPNHDQLRISVIRCQLQARGSLAIASRNQDRYILNLFQDL